MSASLTPVAGPIHADEKYELGLNETTLVLLGAAILLFSAILWTARGPNLEKIDFSVTYLGLRMVHQGEGAQLYDVTEQVKLRSALYQHPNPLIYEHPPFEALVLSPLAALPYRTAYVVWASINALIWLTLPLVLRPYAPVPRDTLAYLALWFIFAPLGVALYQGQSSVILLLVYIFTYLNIKQRRDLLAGVCLGLGLFKFQFVIPFALIFLLRKKWRFLAGFAMSATGLGALSLLAVKWRGLVSYAHLLLSIGGNPRNVSYGSAIDMPTLHGFVYAILGRVVGVKVISSIVAVFSILLILFTAARWENAKRERPGDRLELFFAAAVAVSLMTGLHMFMHDFSPLMLALLLTAAHFPSNAHPWLRWVLAGTMGLFWIPPLYFVLVSWHRLYLMFSLLAVFWLLTLSASELRLCSVSASEGG
jgi:hypothetical protein